MLDSAVVGGLPIIRLFGLFQQVMLVNVFAIYQLTEFLHK